MLQRRLRAITADKVHHWINKNCLLQTKSYFSQIIFDRQFNIFFQKALVTPHSDGFLKRVKLRASNLPEHSPTSVNNIVSFLKYLPSNLTVWKRCVFSPSTSVINNAAASVWVSPSDWFLQILLVFPDLCVQWNRRDISFLATVLWNYCSCFTEESADGSFWTRRIIKVQSSHQPAAMSRWDGCVLCSFFFLF